MADIIKRHNLTYHLYADAFNSVSFNLGSDDLLSSVKSNIELCVQEINNQIILNGVKLNEEITELLYVTGLVRVGCETIHPSSSVRYLGVILDPSADMEITLKRYARHVIFI